jgi:hypothetical protein
MGNKDATLNKLGRFRSFNSLMLVPSTNQGMNGACNFQLELTPARTE